MKLLQNETLLPSIQSTMKRFFLLTLTLLFAHLGFAQLSLQGILDFDLSGSSGKAIHVKTTAAITDLSEWGLGVANNGGGTDGVEYTFPAVSPAVGADILVVRDSQAMAVYFDACFSEFEHVFIDPNGNISQNGDDAIELFKDSVNVETYGDVNVDGTGEPWEYTDSWAYKDGFGNWSTGGVNCTDGSTTTQGSSCPYPLCVQPSNALILKGIIDFSLSSVSGKAVHVQTTAPIADLSAYGIGVANNGGGTDGVEYTFPPVSPAVGVDILVVRDSQAMADYFAGCFGEFEHVFVDPNGNISQNGDDAIELFKDSINIETYGNVNVDGTGEPWEYTDSWAYKDSSGNWSTGGIDCTDGSTTTQSSNCPYPMCPAPVANNVTFQVDMNQYTGTFTTVYVNGDFNGWCGPCNPMTDADGDNVWELTLPLTQDSIEYKFTLDGWTVQENFTPGDPCTKTTSGFTNRFLIINGTITLPAVCWESCSVCPAPVNDLILKGILDFDLSSTSGKAVHVQATVAIADLSRYGIGVANNGGGTDGVEYTFPAVSPAAGDDILVVRDSQAMADYFDACFTEFEHVFIDPNGNISQNGDDAIELFLDSVNIETYGDVNVDGTGEPWEYTDSWAYKDAAGMWSTGGINCTDGSTTTYTSTCPYPLCPALPPATKLVTFQVDVSQFTGGTFTTVHLNGDFNGWCGTCNPMTDANNDGTWELTLPLTQDSIEYKFTMDGWTIDEQFTPGDPCTKTTGQFTNRFLVLTADTTLPAVCWEACSPCPPVVNALQLQGIIDFDVPEGGAAGKAVHVRVVAPIADLSDYGLGVANNGGGTDGQEYTFPAAVPAVGDDILVVRDSQAMANYFDICFPAFEHVFIDGDNVISQNGDDAIELFKDSLVIETYGDPNVDGTGEPWEYSDSWAFKDSMGVWSTGGVDCTDSSTTTLSSNCPYPMCIGSQPVLVTSITVQGQGGATSISTPGGSLQMEASVTPANATDPTVTWSVDNTSIATVDGNGLLEANSNGQVLVTATANDGSGVTGSATITISNQSTGIDDPSLGWKVYPNPATSAITIDLAGTLADVIIYSTTGQVMTTQQINGVGQISLDQYANGIYLVEIRSGETAQQIMITKM